MMTDLQIEQMIDWINGGSFVHRWFFDHLRLNVYFGKFLPEFQGEELPAIGGYDGYLIKDEALGTFVGFVMDRKDDLQVFLKEEFRKGHLMSTALRDVVLPHLFSQSRTSQKATYKDETRAGYS